MVLIEKSSGKKIIGVIRGSGRLLLVPMNSAADRPPKWKDGRWTTPEEFETLGLEIVRAKYSEKRRMQLEGYIR